MDLARVYAVIAGLQAQGKRVSVRHLHAYTGGSFRDVSRLLREARATRTDATTPDPAPFSPVADFLLECCILAPEQSTSTLHLKMALMRWCVVTKAPVSWVHLKQALHRLGCRAAHGGHTWHGVTLHAIGPHMPRPSIPTDDTPVADLPACERCDQSAWEPRYGDEMLQCRTCHATVIELRARILRLRWRGDTLFLVLQHSYGLLTACVDRRQEAWQTQLQAQWLYSLSLDRVLRAWGTLRRTGPSARDVVFDIISAYHY